MTIRWIGTAMFVAVLIFWGAAAVQWFQTSFDLGFLHSAREHRLHFAADRASVHVMNKVEKSDLTSSGGGAYMRHDSRRVLGVVILRAVDFDDATYSTPYGWMTSIEVPWWHLLALTLPFAARTAQLTIRRRRTRANPTACKSCGYDLRAGHDKCPECGGESHVPIGASNSTSTPSAPTVQR